MWGATRAREGRKRWTRWIQKQTLKEESFDEWKDELLIQHPCAAEPELDNSKKKYSKQLQSDLNTHLRPALNAVYTASTLLGWGSRGLLLVVRPPDANILLAPRAVPRPFERTVWPADVGTMTSL